MVLHFLPELPDGVDLFDDDVQVTPLPCPSLTFLVLCLNLNLYFHPLTFSPRSGDSHEATNSTITLTSTLTLISTLSPPLAQVILTKLLLPNLHHTLIANPHSIPFLPSHLPSLR